jgi:hypothetical protein
VATQKLALAHETALRSFRADVSGFGTEGLGLEATDQTAPFQVSMNVTDAWLTLASPTATQ